MIGSLHLEGPMIDPKEIQKTTSASGYSLVALSSAERDALASSLTPEEKHILLNHGTERAFCGTLLNNKKSGVYACRLCALPLFQAGSKFESGTGWPSFNQPFDPDHIAYIKDSSY